MPSQPWLASPEKRQAQSVGWVVDLEGLWHKQALQPALGLSKSTDETGEGAYIAAFLGAQGTYLTAVVVAVVAPVLQHHRGHLIWDPWMRQSAGAPGRGQGSGMYCSNFTKYLLRCVCALHVSVKWHKWIQGQKSSKKSAASCIFEASSTARPEGGGLCVIHSGLQMDFKKVYGSGAWLHGPDEWHELVHWLDWALCRRIGLRGPTATLFLPWALGLSPGA